VAKWQNADNLEIVEYKPNTLEKIIDFLINPVFHGVLIMIIIGGIYFELQSPGVGFPLMAAILAAILYFAPLYIEGLAQNWEILIFITGIILLMLEFFVIPGFGIAGISGVVLAITGLTMSLIDNIIFSYKDVYFIFYQIITSFTLVIISFLIPVITFLFLGNKIFEKTFFNKIILKAEQNISEGFVSVKLNQSELKGKEGKTITDLRPAGKVLIGDEIYDALAMVGFIPKNTNVVIVKTETGQVYVLEKK